MEETYDDDRVKHRLQEFQQIIRLIQNQTACVSSVDFISGVDPGCRLCIASLGPSRKWGFLRLHLVPPKDLMNCNEFNFFIVPAVIGFFIDKPMVQRLVVGL